MEFPIRRPEGAVRRQPIGGQVIPAASKGSTQMRPNLKALTAMTVVGVLGFLAPAASASPEVKSTRAAAALSLDSAAFIPGPLSFIGPMVAPGSFGVIGPTVYTVGDANVFVGTTITTTAGGAIVGAGPGG
jgi:hypothetical protein